MKDELMNVKIKFTEQSQQVAELKQEISRLETKVIEFILGKSIIVHNKLIFFSCNRIPKWLLKVNFVLT